MKLNKRLVFGILSIVLAAVVALIGIPAVLGQQNQKTVILRVKTDIEKGMVITSEQIESVEVSALNLPADVANDATQVVGKYALVDMVAGDYFLPSKVSSKSPVKDTVLSELSDGKVAVSKSITSFAGSLSNKLKAGDIVGIYRYEDGVEMVEELQYVSIIALTNSSGINIEDATGDESTMAATVTFLATYAQAEKIIEIENESPMHMVLVCRDNEKRAKELLAEQERILNEIALREEENKETSEADEEFEIEFEWEK